MKSRLKYGDTTIEYDIIYSNRKTLEISVKAPDIVTVRCPNHLNEDEIEKSVRNRGRWIIEKLYLLSKVNTIPINREYVPGESFLYLGRNYSLRIVVDEGLKKPEVKLFRGRFIINTPAKDEELMKSAMEAWYKEKAKKTIEERVKYYSKYFKIKPNKVKIKAQKSRWGSCTSKNDLLFNYKLIMAPSPVLDYVVVHEMCHMEHKDHSRNFWNRVKSILSDFEERRRWLREHGVKMDL